MPQETIQVWIKGFLFIFRRVVHVIGIIYIRTDERRGNQKLEFARIALNPGFLAN
jgi:uncharacterized membrane protein YecN with MAPEG domain